MSAPKPLYSGSPPFFRKHERLPVMNGVFLQVVGALFLWVALLPKLMYQLTGFTSLRKHWKILDSYEPRYSPTVVPPPGTHQREKDTVDSYTQWSRRVRQAKAGVVCVDDFHQAYLAGEISPSDVVEALFPLIRRGTANTSMHAVAFSQLNLDAVRSAAAASTERYRNNSSRGPLDGVPVGIKDQVYVKDYETTFGTKTSSGVSTVSSWCVQQWVDAGAIIIGMLNMHEMGMDTTNNNPNHGTPRNPHNSMYYTGGSSGGSAYAVAAGLCPIALGADGGGSIRLPSSFCGIYGLKPSHDRVSGFPQRGICASTGVIGPIASNMADLELSYRLMAKPNPQDPLSAAFQSPAKESTRNTKTLGICRPWYERADTCVRLACDSAIDHLVKTSGYKVQDIDLPFLGPGQMAHALTILSEAMAAVPDISHMTPANQILFSVARQGKSLDILLAQKLRTLLMEHLAALWRDHPGLLIVTPTCPMPGWPIRKLEDLNVGCSDPTMSIRSMEYVWLANFAGAPAISVPVGYTAPAKGDGDVPLGLMLMGEWGSENVLLETGTHLEAYLQHQTSAGRRTPKSHIHPVELAKRAMTERTVN